VTVTSVNDAPTFAKGADQNVPMNAPAQSVANWATGISVGPANEAGQTAAFTVTGNTNPTLFSVAPSVDATGRLTYTPAAGRNGLATITLQLQDNGGVANGGRDTSAAVTFTINVIYVNTAPSFVKGPDQVLLGNPGARTVSPWATSISAGPAGDAGQILTFTATNNNAALFTVAPAVSPAGVLTYTIAPNAIGSALVTVVLKDNGGTLNGGADTSAPQTFTISVNKASTATALTSSNLTSLFGVEITLTATVTDVAPGLGIPTGTIIFQDGTTALGTAVALVNGVATMKTSSLGVATHSLAAVYTPTGNFQGSTSAAISEVIKPSSILKVNFSVHSMLDNTPKPKVQDFPVSGATVKVYSRLDSCANGLYVLQVPLLWGRIYDGFDGVGGTDPGCTPVSVGSYQAVATTDALGNATIIVPPTASSPNTDYLIVGRTDKFDYIQTATSTDPLYSEYTLGNINASQSKNVTLHQLATFNGKILPAKQTEYFGSYLDLVEPDYVDWTDDVELYPFVLVSQGTWDITTAVAPPAGFVADAPALSTTATDTTTAMQFTLTDVGSDWTQTTVNHAIVHLGATTNTTTTIPMNNRRRSKAKNDNVSMMQGDGSVSIPVLANDYIGIKATTLALTSFTQAGNGVVTQSGNTLVYAPNAGFSGADSFTYTLTDDTGFQSTATVNVKVLPTPALRATTTLVNEGNAGLTAAVVSVVLSNPSVKPVTVSYATADGTATAGLDYQAKTGSVTINPGDTRADVAFAVIGDVDPEFNETFAIKLSSPVNAVLADGSDGQVRIQDDDQPEASIADVSVTEGDLTKTVLVTVKLTQKDPMPVTVNYATADGTATAGADYVAASGTLTFTPGVSTLQIPITVLGDTASEATERFFVDISGPVNATIGVSRATVTLTNDDLGTTTVATVADFQAGTTAGGAALTQTADGEVSLAAALGSEFFGTALPAGWTSRVLAAGGTAVVGGGSDRKSVV